jgi:hypothetical protein
LIPYEVISPLWSDGTLKKRWVTVPTTGVDTQVRTDKGEHWQFPEGSVFVKHFDIQTNHLDPNAIRRLETRFLIVQEDGSTYGATYRWLPDHSDALLLEDGEQETFQISSVDGLKEMTWDYPSRSDCLQCHTPASGFVLGVSAKQLNHSMTYPTTETLANQLETWNQIGLFHPNYTRDDLETLPRMVDPLDKGAALQDRARSYLDSNCAGCHRPGGVRAGFDARFTTPLEWSGLFQRANHNLGVDGMRFVHPRLTSASAIFQRMQRRDTEQMPPLATHVPDTDALLVLQDWIEAMSEVTIVVPDRNQTVHALDLDLELEWIPGTSPLTRTQIQVNDREEATIENLGGATIRLMPGPNRITATAQTASGVASVAGPLEIFAQGQGPALVWSTSVTNTPWHPTLKVPLSIEPMDPLTEFERVEFFIQNELVAVSTVAPHEVILALTTPGAYTAFAVGYTAEGDWNATEFWQFSTGDTRSISIRWADFVQEIPHLTQPNLAPDMEFIDVFWQWYGYFGKPEVLSMEAPDPFGTQQAVRFDTGDFGGDDHAMSGYLVVTEQPLPEQRYQVSAWLRSLDTPFPMRLGMTDLGYDMPITVSEDWTRFRATFDYSWCNCYADYRYFQVYEAMLNNPGWEMAEPSVYPVRDVYLQPVLSDTLDVVTAWYLVSGEASDPVTPQANGRLKVSIHEPGFYAVAVKVETASGFEATSDPAFIQVGDLPRLSWDVDSNAESPVRQLLMRAPVDQPYTLEHSTDLVTWTVYNTSVTQGEWTVVQDLGALDGEEDGNYFRVRLLPKPLDL